MMLLGLPPLSDIFKTPAIGSLGDFTTRSPVTTIAPTYKPAPGGGAKNVGFNTGSAAGGAAQGAIAGSAFGPIGTGVGAAIGLLSGGFGAPTSVGKGGGLTDAFASGLGSLGIGGGRTQPVTVTQAQSVDQSNTINVSNILGGKTFGGVTESGDFDTFQAISDVFKIRDAMNQNGQVSVASTTPASILNQAKDYRPFIFLGAAAIAFFLLTRR